jgi:hypothetical protein
MGIKDRLRKVEQETEEFYETLELPDGTKIRYEVGEMFEALSAVLDHREHHLLPNLRQIDTNQGMPGLVRALEGRRERVEGGERDDA